MSIQSFLTHRVTVKRLTAGTGVTKTWAVTATDVRTMIQPLDAEAQQAANLNFTSAYKAFLESSSDVVVGDQLTDQTGRKFVVRGLRSRNYGTLGHKELLLEQDGSN